MSVFEQKEMGSLARRVAEGESELDSEEVLSLDSEDLEALICVLIETEGVLPKVYSSTVDWILKSSRLTTDRKWELFRSLAHNQQIPGEVVDKLIDISSHNLVEKTYLIDNGFESGDNLTVRCALAGNPSISIVHLKRIIAEKDYPDGYICSLVAHHKNLDLEAMENLTEHRKSGVVFAVFCRPDCSGAMTRKILNRIWPAKPELIPESPEMKVGFVGRLENSLNQLEVSIASMRSLFGNRDKLLRGVSAFGRSQFFDRVIPENVLILENSDHIIEVCQQHWPQGTNSIFEC